MNIFDRMSIAYEAFRNPQAQSQRSSDWHWGWSSSGVSGGVDSNKDIIASENGAALLYTVNVAVMSAIKVWENWLEGLKWEIRDSKTDKVLADSEMRSVESGMVGARYYNALKFHRDYFKHSYFKSIAFSDKLYGESYVRRVPNLAQSITALQWLNPLVTEPLIIRGKVERFQYTGQDESRNFYPYEVAYRIANRDPDDDMRGQSPVLSAIDAANIERNTKRAIRNFFRNGMILGGLIMPASDNATLSPAQIAEREEKLQERFKGVSNAGRFLLLPTHSTVENFPSPDIEKDYSVIQPLRNEILMALGVPPQIANDPSQVNYDNADDVKRGWWESWAKPYALDVARFENAQTLPYLEPDTDCYFAFDLSPYETENPETVSADMQSGIIDITTAQERRGYDVNPKLTGIYVINGIPMHEDVIATIARRVPSQYALDMAQADKADAEASSAEGQPSDVVSNDNADVVNVDSTAQTETDGYLYDANGIAIPQSEIFGYHIDAGIVQINEARAGLGLPPIQEKEADTLQQLQSQLSVMNSAVAAGIPTAIAAQMVGLVLPEEMFQVTPQNARVFVQRIKSLLAKNAPRGDAIFSTSVDNHSHSEFPSIAPFTSKQANPRDELVAWHKAWRGGLKRNFEAIWLRGDIGDALQKALDSKDYEQAIAGFNQAFETLDKQIKAIQATRLDFENDFDTLLKRARAEKMGRAQWASAMRSIIRRFGQRAYIDGMTDGGVEDDPSDDDKITINQLASDASQYVTELGNVLYKEDGISDAQADVKAAMWYNKSIEPFYKAGLLSADANGLYEWVYGDTEHCEDCQRLNGQRHRLKGWQANYWPQSDLLECKGFNCECRLVKAKGKARGNY